MPTCQTALKSAEIKADTDTDEPENTNIEVNRKIRTNKQGDYESDIRPAQFLV